MASHPCGVPIPHLRHAGSSNPLRRRVRRSPGRLLESSHPRRCSFGLLFRWIDVVERVQVPQDFQVTFRKRGRKSPQGYSTNSTTVRIGFASPKPGVDCPLDCDQNKITVSPLVLSFSASSNRVLCAVQFSVLNCVASSIVLGAHMCSRRRTLASDSR